MSAPHPQLFFELLLGASQGQLANSFGFPP